MSGNCLGKEEPKADLGEVNSSETGLLKKERNKELWKPSSHEGSSLLLQAGGRRDQKGIRAFKIKALRKLKKFISIPVYRLLCNFRSIHQTHMGNI